jgi:hypothetical protein
MKTLLLLGTLALLTSIAEGRGFKSTSLDQSPDEAELVVIAKVKDVTQIKKERVNDQPIENLDVKVTVIEAIKGTATGDLVVRHRRVGPNPGPTGNGFSFVELAPGDLVVLFLQRVNGKLSLVAEEDDGHFIRLSDVELLALPAASKSATPWDRLVVILEQQLSGCKDRCHVPIWLLSQSPRYKKQMDRKLFVAELVRVTKDVTEQNSLLAAYTVLGQMGETSILPSLIARMKGPNDVSWLQGYEKPVEMKALQEVIAKTKDADTRRRATERLAYLKTSP